MASWGVDMATRCSVLVDCLTSETRTAVLIDDEPIAFTFHPPEFSPGLGDVYLARARKVTGGGVFLELGKGIDGFIPAASIKGRSLSDGDLVVAEVRREGGGGKGCRMAPVDAPIDEDHALRRLRHGPGLALEALTGLDEQSVEVIVVEGPDQAVSKVRDSIARERPELTALVERYSGAKPLFQHAGIEDELASTTEPEVALPGGGRLIIERAAALTAVDIDSGPSSLGQANREAVPLIARACRLRGLAGVILIDPAGSNDHQQGFRLAEALGTQFEALGTEIDIKGVTRTGLVEMVRRKVRESGAETQSRLRSRVYAAFRAAHAAQADEPGKAMAVRANIDLIELMSRDTFAPDHEIYRARHGLDLRLEVEKVMGRGMFEIESQSI